MTQKEATVTTLLAVLAARDVEYELNGEQTINEVLTAEDKANARECIFAMFRNGEIGFKDEATTEKYASDSALKVYVSGLVNNHSRKHKPFNSGQAYKAKNPGSRANSSDEQMKELKKLLAQTSEASDIADINEAIAFRASEIAASKVKDVVINAEALPEALRHLVKS